VAVLSGLENPLHWLVVLAIALVLFGPKRLPELGRSLGAGLRGFKEALGEESPADKRSELKDADREPTAVSPRTRGR
jgi:sec-independent protein translocase protein TatA